MPEKLVQLSGIGKRFGANRVLENVSFDLAAGEVHVLAGENGAGKSTLLKILAGVYPDFEGSIEVAGRAVRFANPLEANRHGIAVIHQELSLVDSMSVADNICLGRESTSGAGWWLARRRQIERAREVCSRLDLEFSSADLLRPVEQFPLSVKNRIEIAKALAGDARILVMDEPTSALNRTEVDKLFALMENLKRRGCGLVYISHKMEEIYRVADRITVLRDGRWVGTAPAAECPEPKLIRWMMGRELAAESALGLPAVALAKEGTTRATGPKAIQDGGEKIRLDLRNFRVPSSEPDRPDAVRGLSIAVAPGEIVGFAGLQGAGIAELFRGLFDAAGASCTGEIEIDGETFRPNGPADSIRRGLAYVGADRKATGLVLGMSVANNVSLASLRTVSPGGVLRSDLERRQAERCVAALHIRLDSIGQEAGTLSGGNQQKVVLAKWLETRPRIMLLEEPTRGVDIGGKHEIYTLLRRLAEEGLAILFTSTEMPELLGLCDRIAVLHRGELMATFDRRAATPEKILAAAMGARETGSN